MFRIRRIHDDTLPVNREAIRPGQADILQASSSRRCRNATSTV